MKYQELDQLFPFLVFVYGVLMTIVLNTDFFQELADRVFPAKLLTQFRAHRVLGFVCLLVGGLWILQNLWVEV